MTTLTFASLLGIGYMAACAVRYLPRPMLIKISLYVAALYATQHHVGLEATIVAGGVPTAGYVLSVREPD